MKQVFRGVKIDWRERKIQTCKANIKYHKNMVAANETEILQLNKEIEEVEMEGG